MTSTKLHLPQAWLAVSDDRAARETGGFFYHQRPADMHKRVDLHDLQELVALKEGAVAAASILRAYVGRQLGG